MKRENRYIVIKRKDAEAALDKGQLEQLNGLSSVVSANRKKAGKLELNCVVVESDWPEYEPTWAAIEARIGN